MARLGYVHPANGAHPASTAISFLFAKISKIINGDLAAKQPVKVNAKKERPAPASPILSDEERYDRDGREGAPASYRN